MLSVEVLDDPSAVEPWRASWDALAAAAGRPYAVPAWGLGWWRHAAPAGAQLRVLLAHEGGELVGAGAFVAVRERGVERWTPPGAESARDVEPVARAWREVEVAEAFAAALREERPDVLAFPQLGSARWPRLLAGAWPGRVPAWTVDDPSTPAPVVRLAGGFEAWSARRSSNLRQQLRRSRKALEKDGATLRTSTDPEQRERDLDAFAALHRSYWASRGGTAVLTDGIEAMVRDCARELGPDRVRLFCVEREGEVIAVQLMVAAGEECGYWLGGWDERFAKGRPGLVALAEAIEDAAGRGELRVDLGAGDQGYKYRLADGEDRLHWWYVVPPGPRAVVAAAPLVPLRARAVVAAHLPERAKEPLRPLVARVRGLARTG